MNVEIGTEAAQLPEKEYINEIFLAMQVKIVEYFQPKAIYAIVTKMSKGNMDH
jgi:hypothetical protein